MAATQKDSAEDLKQLLLYLHSVAYVKDRQTNLDFFIRGIREIFPCEAAALFMTTRAHPDELRLNASSSCLHGLRFAPSVLLPIHNLEGKGLTGKLAYDRKVVRLYGGELRQHPFVKGAKHEHLKHGGCFSLLAIPLIDASKHLIGLVKLENRQNGTGLDHQVEEFTADDELLLTSNAAAIAELLSAINTFENFHRAAREAEGTPADDDIFASVIRAACDTSGYLSGIVYETDEANSLLRCVAYHGSRSEERNYSLFTYELQETSAATRAYKDRKEYFSENPWNDPVVNKTGLLHFEIKGPLSAFPLIVGDRVVGVLALWDRSPGKTFDRTGLDSIADSLAILMSRLVRENTIGGTHYSLLAGVPVGVFYKDTGSHLVSCNAHHCNLLQKDIRDILGKTDRELFPEELAEKFIADDQRVMQTKEVYSGIERHRGLDGLPVFVQVIKHPWFGPDGKICGIQGAFFDVTPQQLAAQQTRGEELAKLGTWELIDGKVTASEALYKIVDIQPSAKVDIDLILARVISQDRPRLRAAYLQLSKGTEKVDINIRFRIKGAPRLLRLIVERIPGPSRGPIPPVRGAVQDITAQYQSDRLEAAGAFALRLAHDFRTPLATVRMDAAYLAQALAPATPETMESIKRIDDMVDFLFSKIHTFNTFMHDAAGELASYSIGELVKRSVALMASHFGTYRILPKLSMDADLPDILVDKSEILSVIISVLTNSVEAMKEGGTITIKCCRGCLKTGGKVLIDGENEEEDVGRAGLVVEVADDGKGFSEDYLKNRFSLGLSEKPRAGMARGQGLSACKVIMEMNGGFIDLGNNHNGPGAFVRLWFPFNL